MSMILYNIRYRGPYEYDKFVLDIFQTCNEVQRLIKKFHECSKDTVENKKGKLEEIMGAISGEKGLLQEILLMQTKRS